MGPVEYRIKTGPETDVDCRYCSRKMTQFMNADGKVLGDGVLECVGCKYLSLNHGNRIYGRK